MNATTKAVADMLKVNDSLFVKGVEGMSDETALACVSDNGNPILWLAGHITSCRHYLLNNLGVDKEVPWGKTFVEKFDPARSYPTFQEIVAAWKEVSEVLSARIPQLSDADLAKSISDGIPTEQRNAAGAMVFWMYHEAWHVGQIAYVKKCLGQEGLVPY